MYVYMNISIYLYIYIEHSDAHANYYTIKCLAEQTVQEQRTT